VERIQQVCEQKNISIGTMEKDLGFSRGSVYKWHKSSPKSDALFKVAQYLDVPMETFFYDTYTRSEEENDDEELKEFISSKGNEPYIILSAKAKKQGIPPEVMQKLIDIYTKQKEQP
jgi:transcriptional regulator with XRE-family HTH domain